MRTFITDAFLLRMLDEIESAHGKRVRTEILPPEAGFYLAASYYAREADEFSFLYSPERPPTQQVICHELLHICLILDGWPLIESYSRTSNSQTFEYALTVFLDLQQHVALWPMMEKLGYSEECRWTHDLVTLLIPECAYTSFHQKFDLRPRTLIRGALLAEAILSPAKEEPKKILRSLCRERFPEENQLAESIAARFEHARPFSPQSCIAAFAQSYEEAKGRLGSLRFSFLPRIQAVFCQRILDLRTEHAGK